MTQPFASNSPPTETFEVHVGRAGGLSLELGAKNGERLVVGQGPHWTRTVPTAVAHILLLPLALFPPYWQLNRSWIINK